VVIAVLLVVAMAHTFVTRARATTPAWMSRLEGASPRLCFVLGFLLLGVFPTDILTSLSVRAYVAANGDRWVSVLPFVALTLVFLAVPGLVAPSFRRRHRCGSPTLGVG
jgi:hypothetical protein